MFEFEAKLQIQKDISLSFDTADFDSFDTKTKTEPTYRDEQTLQKFIVHAGVRGLMEQFPVNRFFLQRDCYYNHPLWNYKEKHMALRKREQIAFNKFLDFSQASRNASRQAQPHRWRFAEHNSLLTFKNKMTDAEFKMRKEYEFEVNSQLWQVLQENGFSEAACVNKKRWSVNISDGEFAGFSLAFDCVAGLGLYLEIEIITSKQETQKLTAQMNRFLDIYNLRFFPKEDVSYLGLLLQDS